MALRRRAMPSCALVLFGLLLIATGAAQAGTTYRFGGATVFGCSLSGKVYSCPSTGLAWDDRIVIDSGYTVNVQGDVSFQYTQGLSMSGTARLTSTGNLNIGDIQTSNISITGGSFSAGKTFSVGAQPQTIKADITAASMMLGTGSTLQITGTLVSTGAVQIASNTTIVGPVTGTAITIGTPVKITGDVKASTSLFLGSGSTIDGNVDTGQMTLQSSNALITGNASVDFATLQYNGRVAKKIICKSGTRPGLCDCVDNQSGNPVNSNNGPTCESPKPAAGTLRHLLITHDGSAGTCTTEQVTVTACANANCSAPHFSGGASATLQPGGAQVVIGSSGIATANVTSIVSGTNKLSLTGTSTAVQCLNSATRAASCDMNFTGDVNFQIEVADHKAGNTIDAIIKAVKPNAAKTECVPGFNMETKNVEYSCNYVLPASGTLPMRLEAQTFACNATGITMATAFDSKGETKLALIYPDAGKVALNARLDKITGKKEFIVAPDSFEFIKPASLRAGADFDLKVYARNSNGHTTPNFHKNGLSTQATRIKIARECIRGNLPGQLTDTFVEFDKGETIATMNFDEAGHLDVVGTLNDFLGSGPSTVTSSGPKLDQCEGNIGPFVPWAFQVELNNAARKASNFYYAGEPIGLTISALNKQGIVTKNYPTGYGSDQTIKLSALQEDGKVFATAPGALSGSFPAKGFSSGVTPASGTDIPKPVYAFTSTTQQPVQIRLRADNGLTAADLITSATAVVGTSPPEMEQARPWIRIGRMRLGNRFGRTGASPIKMPLTVEYWSGQSWVLNQQDSFTFIPGMAFAQTASAAKPGGAVPATPGLSAVQIKEGAGSVAISGNQPGSIDVAINLAFDTGVATPNTSCLKIKASSRSASLPWLRSLIPCQNPAGNPDPSARATFGIFPVENSRIIHVREVFN